MEPTYIPIAKEALDLDKIQEGFAKRILEWAKKSPDKERAQKMAQHILQHSKAERKRV